MTPDPIADQILDYLWYAERYQWTPKQVREEVDGWVAAYLPAAAQQLDRVREAAQKKAIKDARG